MPTAVKGSLQIEGQEVAITNPNKLLWPEEGITKLMFISKLIELSPYLLKYCRNRYLTTIRFPDGYQGKSFYQKNTPEPTPPFVSIAPLLDIRYVHLDSLPTLVWLGNLASVEYHPSLHYIDSELPAEWLIDLDPTLEEEPRIWEAAAIVGETLRSLGIESVPKTSGATGIQIWVPIQPGYTFEQLRAIGHFIAQFLVQKHGHLFTIERLKKDRGSLIYFDYLQHWYGKTLSAPYTPRARQGAPVSTPLHWEEVSRPGQHAANFNLLNSAERLQKLGDLIEQTPKQNLDDVLRFIGALQPKR